jgi:hypothetical protein
MDWDANREEEEQSAKPQARKRYNRANPPVIPLDPPLAGTEPETVVNDWHFMLHGWSSVDNF